MIPRRDVGTGGLAGLFLAMAGNLLAAAGVVDFSTLFGVLGALVTFLGGFLPRRYKSLWSVVGAGVAIVATYILAPLLGFPQDTATLSAALVSLGQAALTYFTRGEAPDSPTNA